ncbi:MAG: hypothetical protein U0640_10920 [Phycisphaerales bacterium]
MHIRQVSRTLASCALLISSIAAQAQPDCDPNWDFTTTQTPIGANITDSVRLSNGDIVVIGDFQQIAGVPASRIARWDGTNWFAFGQGLNAVPSEIELHPAGGFVVSGAFTQADTTPANHIARWDGSSWSSLGTGIATNTTQLAVAPNGNVFVLSTPTLNRWNGTNWSTIPATLSSGGAIYDMLAMQNNNLVVGGIFTTINGVTVSNHALWNGITWSRLGTEDLLPIGKLALSANGHVYAASIGAVFFGSSVFDWNGTSWTTVGSFSGSGFYPHELKAFPNGNLLISTSQDFTPIFPPLSYPYTRGVQLWNGSTWNTLAGDSHTNTASITSSLEPLPNGDILALGSFAAMNGLPIERMARWNGTAWLPVVSRGDTPNNEVHTIAEVNPHMIIVAGAFSGFGDRRAERFMMRDWNGWTTLPTPGLLSAPSPLDNPARNPIVKCSYVEVGNNVLFAGENFSSVLRWNGTTWSSLPSSTALGFYNVGTGAVDPGDIFSVTKLQDGTIIAAGSFNPPSFNQFVPVFNHIARYTGSAWAAMGDGFSPPFSTKVYALLPLSNGDLIAAGTFSQSGSTPMQNIARWDGTTWSQFAGGITGSSVRALLQLQSGDIIAGGLFTAAGGVPASNIASWDGFAWHSLGSGTNGQVNTLADRYGTILAGGTFTSVDGIPANRIASYFNSVWSPIREGVTPESGSTFASVNVIEVTELDHIFVGGSFSRAGVYLSPNLSYFTYPVDCGLFCNDIDFNNDGSYFDPQDIDAFLSVYSEGPCIPAAAICDDIDFNNDTSIFDPCDINGFLALFTEGPCTTCGL